MPFWVFFCIKKHGGLCAPTMYCHIIIIGVMLFLQYLFPVFDIQS